MGRQTILNSIVRMGLADQELLHSTALLIADGKINKIGQLTNALYVLAKLQYKPPEPSASESQKEIVKSDE